MQVIQQEKKGLETHLWVGNHSREVKLDGKPIVLYRCPLCARDFSREPGSPNWRAIAVSTFRIAMLPDEVSQTWVTEPCPGLPRPAAEELPIVEAPEATVISVAAEPEPNPRRLIRVARRRRSVRAAVGRTRGIAGEGALDGTAS